MENKKILVVEDDPIIRLDITQHLLSKSYEIVGSFGKESQVLTYFLTMDSCPDLAVFDINLAGNYEGISLADIARKKFNIPVIFLTSYTDRDTMSKAFSVNPSSYLVKPFDADDLFTNIELALFKNKSLSIASNRNTEEPFYIKTDQKLIRLELGNISIVQSMENYSIIIVDNEKHVVNQSLKALTEKLSILGFMRIHKSYLINLNKIDYIYEDMAHIAEHSIPIGRQYKNELLASLKVL